MNIAYFIPAEKYLLVHRYNAAYYGQHQEKLRRLNLPIPQELQGSISFSNPLDDIIDLGVAQYKLKACIVMKHKTESLTHYIANVFRPNKIIQVDNEKVTIINSVNEKRWIVAGYLRIRS